MMESLIIALIVSAAVFGYALWGWLDQRKELVVSRVAHNVASMGDDAVAASLHPVVDLNRCIGSGACVAACPEKVVIGVIRGRAKLVNPLGCIGHGACEAACPVGAITLVYGTKTRGVELPRVDPNFQTKSPGVYVIGELGGMGLIRNAARQGALAAEHVIDGAGNPEHVIRRGHSDALDAIVVGAGPAGISATLRLMEAGLRVRLLERDQFGGTIMHYPRGKVVMAGELHLPLVGRVKQTRMSKEQLVALWEDIRQRYQPPVTTGVLVERLSQDADGMWVVHSESLQLRAANVLLGLGLRGSPRRLGVPGENDAKVSYRLLEPAEFQGKHVLVVGGGNSAVESALALADYGGCASVGISYRKGTFARCRADNQTRIDAAIQSGAVRGWLDTEVREIGAFEVTLTGPKIGTAQISNDAVIIQVGGTPPGQLLRSFGIETVVKHGER